MQGSVRHLHFATFKTWLHKVLAYGDAGAYAFIENTHLSLVKISKQSKEL